MKTKSSPTPNQIIAARRTAGHTQTEAARIVFVVLRTWQDWEGGKYKMPMVAYLLYQLLTDSPARSLSMRRGQFPIAHSQLFSEMTL
jgi:DNA-binding transcriptional regulator YiaG